MCIFSRYFKYLNYAIAMVTTARLKYIQFLEERAKGGSENKVVIPTKGKLTTVTFNFMFCHCKGPDNYLVSYYICVAVRDKAKLI